MNDKFDELAKNLARSVTRRGALKKFGLGLAGLALASLGLTNGASAKPATPPAYHLGGGSKLCNHCVSPYGCAVDSAGNIIDRRCFLFCASKCTR
jgi:hypothetical protein